MGLNNTIFTNESPGLFNGNIAAMMTDIKILATEEDPNVSIYGYAYDQLHRIKKATNYRAFGMGYEGSNKYNTNYSYDPDGNLTNLQRGGQEENNVMDRLSYVYGLSSRPNQLTQVNDLASDGTPGQFSGSEGYDYDNIGNLTETTSNGNLTKIDWDVYNKVKQVTNEDLLTRYLYDGAGNRVLTFKNVGFEERRQQITAYSRDASGNTLAVYDASDGESYPYGHPLEEMYVFGSSRIGVDKTLRTDDRNPGIFIFHKDLTTTHYEISNHLGNVLTTVTGRKLGQVQNDVLDHYLPEVVTATDYYAFGAQMPGRSYENTTLSGTNGYRFAFNGKELDKSGEWGSLNHYDYGFRIYNPAIAKFLSVDPLTKDYPWYTPYQFAGNTPIWAIDLDGLEPKFSNSGSTAAGNSPARDNLPEVTWDDQVKKQYLVDLKEFSTSTHTQNVSNVEVFEPGSEPKSEPPKLGEPYRENVLMYNEVWSRMVLNLPAQGKVESTSFEFEVLGAGIVLKQILSAGSKMIIRAEAMKGGLNGAKGGRFIEQCLMQNMQH